MDRGRWLSVLFVVADVCATTLSAVPGNKVSDGTDGFASPLKKALVVMFSNVARRYKFFI
jgi:hypothetical protein